MLPNNSTNRYGDLLKEFFLGIKNGTLAESRVDDIARVFNELADRENVYRSWLQIGTADPKFPNMSARTGTFLVPPLSGGVLEFIGDTPMTITHNTDTVVSFEQIFGKPNSYRVSADKIYMLTPGKFYLFSGLVQWEANANGRRTAEIAAFDEAGNLQWSQRLHTFAPHGTAVDYLPFSCPLGFTFENAYIEFSVYQDSGGDLDLQYVILGITEFSYDIEGENL